VGGRRLVNHLREILMSFASTRLARALSFGCIALLVGGLLAGCGKNKSNKGQAPTAKTTTPPSSSQTANVVPGQPVGPDYTSSAALAAYAVDVSSVITCGSGTDGLGACTSDDAYLIVCSGGKAYAYDCSQVAQGAVCGTDSDTNQLVCGTSQ
jgi:hypothetical protein